MVGRGLGERERKRWCEKGKKKRKSKNEEEEEKLSNSSPSFLTFQVLAVPLLERLQQLQPVGVGVHGHRGGVGRGRGGLVGVHPGVEPFRRELVADGRRQRNLLAVGADQGVGFGVEREVPRDGVGGDELRGGDEGVRCGVAVVAGGEVAVVGGDDGVGDA